MNFFALLLFLLGGQEKIVRLDPDIMTISHMVFTEDGYFIADNHSEALYKVDVRGKIIRAYRKKGFGPGELTKIALLRYVGGELFVFDDNARKLVILDGDLRFVEQKFIQGYNCRSFDVVRDNLYFFYWDEKHRKIVHRFDRDMNHLGSFGDALDDSLVPKKHRRFFRFKTGSGHLKAHGNRIYVCPSYHYEIQVFDTQGNALATYKIPGLKPMEFYHKKENSFKVLAHHLQIPRSGNNYFLLLNRVPYRKDGLAFPRFYRLNPGKKQWEYQDLRRRTIFLTPEEHFAQVLEDEDETLYLKYFPNPFDATRPTPEEK